MLDAWRLPEDVMRQLQAEYDERERERKARPMIEVSSSAIANFKKLAAQNKLDLVVRIGYRNGSHTLEPVARNAIQPSDHQLTIEAITFLMDPESAEAIWGCKLHFEDRGSQAGFVFD